ncbi:MAG: hypothetical protein ABFE13_22170 [Phycisphaerales bacterium]
MRDFIEATFPCVQGPLGAVNLICRDSERKPDDRSCPFVCLSAYSFANAMLLAMFSEFIEKLDILDSHYRTIEETLERNMEKQPADIAESVKKTTFNAATYLANHVAFLRVQHPVVDIFVGSMKKNSSKMQSVDDITNAIHGVFALFQEVRCGYDRHDAAAAARNLEKLRTTCGPLVSALTCLKRVREETSDHIWKVRASYFETALVTDDDWQGDRKSLETALFKRVLPAIHSTGWILSEAIDVALYSDVLG